MIPAAARRAAAAAAALLLVALAAGGCAIDWIANEGDLDTDLEQRILLGARGNAIWRVGPAGATPSLFYSGVRYPDLVVTHDRVELPYDPAQIEVTGWVETERESSGVSFRVQADIDALGLDGSDYGTAFRELMEVHELHGLMNTVVDTDIWQLNLYFVRFTEQKTRLGGVGYRFRDGVEVPWRVLTEPAPASSPPGDAGAPSAKGS